MALPRPAWINFQDKSNRNPTWPQGFSASSSAISPRKQGHSWPEDRGKIMKIVIIGGTGLIGTKLASKLRQKGHEVIPASSRTGVNTITGEGLDKALSGAEIVVDVANSPSFEDGAVLKFFETSGRNL